MIDIENLTYRLGGRILFENAVLHLPSSCKVGIVGPNGSGKTTLFRIILENRVVDSGEIFIKSGARLVYVRQEIENPDVSLLNFVTQSDVELVKLREILSNPDIDAQRLIDAYARYEAIDGYSADSRAAGILSGLGFKQPDLQRKIGEFSGGWQVRASLAATLFAPSDCLLLDEPTNHLDLETAIWLENFLRKIDKTILMISHEKQFLNSICTHIVSISNRKLQLYKGNYDTYIDTRDKQTTALIKNIQTQQKKREHIQSFIDRFGAKATKARQAQSRVKMLEKMEIPEMPESSYAVKFTFPSPAPEVDRKLVNVENAAVGYGDKIVLRGINFQVSMGDRIAFLGANGNGKSTMAKLLAGRLMAQSGTVVYGRNVKISYFSQQQADELDLQKTPSEILHKLSWQLNETAVRAHLARFGITQERSQTIIKNLSGGEKSRVLLAVNSLFSPHLMILDEPTNHLDIEAREALVAAIKQYTGAVVLITHDFYTLSRTCDKFFIISNGTCSRFSGTLGDYRDLLLSNTSDSPKKKNTQPKQKKSAEADRKKVERQIDELEAQKAELENKLSTSYDRELLENYEKCCAKLSELEDVWLEMSC